MPALLLGMDYLRLFASICQNIARGHVCPAQCHVHDTPPGFLGLMFTDRKRRSHAWQSRGVLPSGNRACVQGGNMPLVFMDAVLSESSQTKTAPSHLDGSLRRLMSQSAELYINAAGPWRSGHMSTTSGICNRCLRASRSLRLASMLLANTFCCGQHESASHDRLSFRNLIALAA